MSILPSFLPPLHKCCVCVVFWAFFFFFLDTVVYSPALLQYSCLSLPSSGIHRHELPQLLEKSGAWGGTERKLRTFAEAGWSGRKLKGKGIPQCPINPSTERWRPKDPKFKGILGYLSTPHTQTHTHTGNQRWIFWALTD